MNDQPYHPLPLLLSLAARHRLRRRAFATLALSLLLTTATHAQSTGPEGGNVTAFAVLEHDLFAAVGGTVFKSSDEGASWEVTDAGLIDSGRIDDLLAAGGSLYAATGRGIFRSRDGGRGWSGPGRVFTDRLGPAPLSLAAVGDQLFATISLEGVFRSSDAGRTWRAANQGLTEKASFLAGPLLGAGEDLYLGTFLSGPNDEAQIFRSGDGAATW